MEETKKKMKREKEKEEGVVIKVLNAVHWMQHGGGGGLKRGERLEVRWGNNEMKMREWWCVDVEVVTDKIWTCVVQEDRPGWNEGHVMMYSQRKRCRRECVEGEIGGRRGGGEECEEDDEWILDAALMEELGESPARGLDEEGGREGMDDVLPEECLLRILSRLSPEALLKVGQTSKTMKRLALDSCIWKGLYHARWPSGPCRWEGEDEELQSWKDLYMCRDAEDAAKGWREGPMEDLYIQMMRAYREAPLTSAQANVAVERSVLEQERLPGSVSDHVRRFKESIGVEENAPSCTDVRHQYVQLLESHWICTACGDVHVCGEACNAREMSSGQEMTVCTLTGRCFTDMVDDGGGGDEELAGGEHQLGEETGIGGRLGRAFFAGYNAADDRDMLRILGIALK